MSSVNISVIVPTFKNEEGLIKAIRDISNQVIEGNLEIIIVNDSEESLPALPTLNNIKVIDNPRRLGLAGSVNNGVENAKYEYCLILHDDMRIPERDWVAQLIKAKDEAEMITTPIILPDEIWSKLGFWEKCFRVWERIAKPSNQRNYLEYSDGKNVLFNKKWFLDQGGFDSKSFKVACEDVDFGIRIRKKGYKILSIPHPIIHHHSSKRTNSIWKLILKDLQIAEANGVLMRRHGKMWLKYNNPLIRAAGFIFLLTPIWQLAFLWFLFLLLSQFIYTYRVVKTPKVILFALVKIFSIIVSAATFILGFVTNKQRL